MLMRRVLIARKQERMEAMRATRRVFLGLAVQATAGVACSVAAAQAAASVTPDYSIEIAETSWEIAPKRVLRTAAYNGIVPGKLLRVKEGRPVAVEIVNRLDRPEIVHWHGQWVPSDVDGAMEAGTPVIPAGGRVLVGFTPKPSGLHWYHTHMAA
jgi:FtsP/CotA-like multicopper oxidase with cupredoxin domain